MVTATVIWGMAFSAQSKGMEFVDPMLFSAMRSATALLSLAVVVAVIDLVRCRRVSLWGDARTPQQKKELVTGGIWCGVILAAASVFQQFGLLYTSAGKTGFLTALYIVIVPVLGVFFKRKTSFVMWLAVVMGLSGAYLLCGGIGNIGLGEWLVIICALLYSFHILVIDRYAAQCDCVRLSTVQFAVTAAVTLLAAVIFSRDWQWEKISGALPFWLFCGIGSSAIAFTLQMVAQKYLHPVTATLLMSLESVFAVLGGWIFLGEVMSPREFSGCAVIFMAIIISQLNFRGNSQSPQKLLKIIVAILKRSVFGRLLIK